MSEQFCSDLALPHPIYAQSTHLKREKIICQRKLQSITKKHQSILRMPHAIMGKRRSITRPEVTRRLRTMLISLGAIHGRGYAEEAVKAHLEEHGKK
jgi:hypothetical protein